MKGFRNRPVWLFMWDFRNKPVEQENKEAGRAVERNLPYALECYKKTASYGNDRYACRQLGRLYFNGWGTAASRTRHGEKHFWRKARIRPIKVMVWG